MILALVAVAGTAGAQAPAPPDPGARVARDREFTEGAWLEPDLAHGAELYQTCAACHGPDGRGTEDGEIPAIAGQHGSVLLKQLTDFRHEQRWNDMAEKFGLGQRTGVGLPGESSGLVPPIDQWSGSSFANHTAP